MFVRYFLVMLIRTEKWFDSVFDNN